MDGWFVDPGLGGDLGGGGTLGEAFGVCGGGGVEGGLAVLDDGGVVAGEILGGILMIAAGTGGEGGGFALDLTGIGLTIGIPVNIASAALISGGVVVASKGLYDYAEYMGKGDNHYRRRRGEQFKDTSLPKADPIGDEARFPDAHTGKKHVGRSDKQLGERLDHEQGPRWKMTHKQDTPAASTYKNNYDAQRFSQKVVDNNSRAIREWLKKAKPGSTKEFEADMGEVSGRHLSRKAHQVGDAPTEVTRARVVLKVDPTAPGGYYTLTSFPIP